MDPTKFLGLDIMQVMQTFRTSEAVFDYVKADGHEFVNFLEQGFYLHAKSRNGVIFDCRIYFKCDEGFLESAAEVRGRFSAVAKIVDLERLLGAPIKEIRSFKIPGRPATRPGKEFLDGDLKVKAFYDTDGAVIYLHLTQTDSEK